MHESVLPRHSLDLLTELGQDDSPLLSNWTLAGGTGLALRLGHRTSEDLDFFRVDPLDVRTLHDVLGGHGDYETLQEGDHTLTVLIRKTKLSFFRVRDPSLTMRTPNPCPGCWFPSTGRNAKPSSSARPAPSFCRSAGRRRDADGARGERMGGEGIGVKLSRPFRKSADVFSSSSSSSFSDVEERRIRGRR